jgi:hypothetical protein
MANPDTPAPTYFALGTAAFIGCTGISGICCFRGHGTVAEFDKFRVDRTPGYSDGWSYKARTARTSVIPERTCDVSGKLQSVDRPARGRHRAWGGRRRLSQPPVQYHVCVHARSVPFAADHRICRRPSWKAAIEPVLAGLRFLARLSAARTYRMGEGGYPSSNLLVWRSGLLPRAVERRRVWTLLDTDANRATLELRVRNHSLWTNTDA